MSEREGGEREERGSIGEEREAGWRRGGARGSQSGTLQGRGARPTPAAGARRVAAAAARLQPTLLFFQLEMQGGIFQSCWSLTVSGRGGECMTGTGGEPGPRGTCAQRGMGRGGQGAVPLQCLLEGPLLPRRVSRCVSWPCPPPHPTHHHQPLPSPAPFPTLMCLNLGGSSGSTGMSCILMMREAAPEACCGPPSAGVYLMYCACPGSCGSVLGLIAACFLSTRSASAAAVSCAVFSISSSSGFSRFCRGRGAQRGEG